MSNVKRLGWCGALALGLLATAASAGDEWETVEDGDFVIKVRPRADGVGKEIWAETDLEADARDIQTALMDAGNFRLFMPYMKESRIVSTAEDGSRVSYAKINPPVVSSRDYALRLVEEKKIAEDGTGEFLQRFKTVDGAVPERKGVVRLKHNEGSWHVTPRGEGKAHVVYKFSVDPSGSVPGWLANIGQSDAVEDMIEAVEGRAQQLGKERKTAKPAPAKP
jgi:hypothetical protein